jgi:hypothetical protein
MIQSLQHLKQKQPPRSLDGSGVVHVVELFSSLPLWSIHAWMGESSNVYVAAVNKVCVVHKFHVKVGSSFRWFNCTYPKIYVADLSSSLNSFAFVILFLIIFLIRHSLWKEWQVIATVYYGTSTYYSKTKPIWHNEAYKFYVRKQHLTIACLHTPLITLC